MTVVSFRISKVDRKLVDGILDRAARERQAKGIVTTVADRRDLSMDIVATHANGTRLDFVKWLSFDAFSFWHDIQGIQRHIDRRTGKLTGHFLPRCYKGPARRKRGESVIAKVGAR
jgi:hypothetical protein